MTTKKHQKSDCIINIRPATPNDSKTISDFIYELGVYERLEHLVRATPEKVHEQLFGANPVAHAVIAEVTDQKMPELGQQRAGFALFFKNFSTFMCKPGLYLEDLYVREEWRGVGLGKALISHLANIAVQQECERFEWSVLDWNQSAIDFYKASGAQVLEDWRICRVSGQDIHALAKNKKS